VELRNDEFQTAMEEPLEDPVLAQLQAMQASLDARFSTLEDNVAALQRHPQQRDPGRPAQKGRPDFLPEKD
jgi:ABC-type phosphate transport system auxiliary subunit